MNLPDHFVVFGCANNNIGEISAHGQLVKAHVSFLQWQRWQMRDGNLVGLMMCYFLFPIYWLYCSLSVCVIWAFVHLGDQ